MVLIRVSLMIMMLSIFSHVCWPCECLLWKNFQVFCPFFDWVVWFLLLSYMNSSCMLDINPLSVISFANIFPHSAGCLFILLMVLFAVQKLLSLISSHLFIFVFDLRSQKDIAMTYVKECSA